VHVIGVQENPPSGAIGIEHWFGTPPAPHCCGAVHDPH
jgi:hypothetical protein